MNNQKADLFYLTVFICQSERLEVFLTESGVTFYSFCFVIFDFLSAGGHGDVRGKILFRK